LVAYDNLLCRVRLKPQISTQEMAGCYPKTLKTNYRVSGLVP
jgi:hypothetical protein